MLQRDPLWAAPLLWRSELRNALNRLVRTDALQLEKALAIIDEADRSLTGHEYSVISWQVWSLPAGQVVRPTIANSWPSPRILRCVGDE